MFTQLKTMNWLSAPVIADLTGLVLYWTLVPVLTNRFQQKSAASALIIGGIYLLFCMAVFAVRRLEGPAEGAYIQPGGLLIFLAVAFGVFVSYMMADAAGVFDNLDALDPNLSAAASIGLLVGAIVWLGFIFLYAGILMANIKPTVAHASAAFFGVELLALLGINLMVMVTVAQWEAFFSDTVPYQGLGLGAKFLIFVPSFAFFMLFYAPPRLLFLYKGQQPISIITFLIQMTYIVWGTLNRVAWH